MSCREHFLKQINDDIRATIIGNATSYKVTDDTIFIPFSDSGRIKSKKASYNVAKRHVQAINSKYLSDRYGNVASVDNGFTDGTAIKIHVPTTLIDAYERKYDESQARQLQLQDAQRAGMSYGDRYMFDYFPASPDAYNFGTYLSNKKKLLDYFRQKVNILEEIPNKTKADLEQMEYFKDLTRRLRKDIKTLESENAQLDNYFSHFENDLDMITDMLSQAPTIDNLLGARNFVDTMKFVYNFGSDTGFSTEAYEELDEATQKLFDDFTGKLSVVDTRLSEAEDKFVENEISRLLKKEDSRYEDEDAEELAKRARDISKAESAFLGLDASTNTTSLQKFVRVVYDNALAKRPTFDIQQQLQNHKAELESRLKELGYQTDSGFMGRLHNAVSYDIFKRKDGGRNRLVGHLSTEWDKFERGITRRFDTIENLVYKKNKDQQDFNKLRQRRRKLFDTLNENVNFIDPRRIPELIANDDLQANFSEYFDQERAEEYKENLINSLIGESGNRQVAERMYDRIVQDQLLKIHAFEISMEQFKNRLFRQYGVDSIDQLPTKAKNNFFNKYYTESPFEFAVNYESNNNPTVATLYFNEEGEQKTGTNISTLEYASYLPKKMKFFDKSFDQEIASDEVLYKAWELFDDSITFINNNRKYSKQYGVKEFHDSLPYEADFYREHSTSVGKLLKYVGKSIRDRIGTVLSTTKYRDTNSDLRIPGGVSSFDEQVENRLKPINSTLKAFGVDFSKTYKKQDLDPKLLKYLEDTSNESVPQFINFDNFSRKMAERNVADSQQLDLVDQLITQLETVEKFKARKEIEAKLTFAKNLMATAKDSEDGNVRKNALETVEFFINRHLYGVNNRANWMFFGVNPRAGKTFYTLAEKEIVNEIDKNIKLIRELADRSDDPKIKEQAEKDITTMIIYKENMGRKITTGSLFETMAIKLPIMVGLGLNMGSQAVNYFMGNLAGRQNDGLEWTQGNFPKAASYARKWKIAQRKLTPSLRERYRLTNTLINNLGIFQNSANELDKIKESKYQSNVLKFVSNPLHIVGEVEKTIQRPQILAMLGDVSIKDKDGNYVPAFNVNDHSNPHPAFDLDSEGNLILKEEFDTKDNRDTWINRNSQEYVNLFGESGVVPSMIARINGDYRDTSVTLVKNNSFTALLMMFKTWLPAFVMRRYGKKEGVISNLLDSKRSSDALPMVMFTSAMYAGIGASLVFSPLFSVAIAGAYMGVKKYKMAMAQDGDTLANLLQEIRDVSISLKFGEKALRFTAAIGAKVGQQTTDLVTGNRLISNEVINNIAGFEQREDETDDEYERNLARLQFLLTEASTTMSLLMMKLLVNAMLYPDLDDDEEYKKDDSPFKFFTRADVAAYYLFENMLTRFGGDVNLLNDPNEMINLIKSAPEQVLSNMITTTRAFSKQLSDGNYKTGELAGKNRVMHQIKKNFVPRGMRDFTFGLSGPSGKDYREDAINRIFMNDFEKAEKERGKQRMKRKKELTKEYESRGWMSEEKIEKKVNKKLRKEFPTIKKYFNPDGSLKDYKKHKVEKYLDEE